MGTLNPAQMFDHSLNVIKGPSLMHRLDYIATPKAGEVIYSGSVCSVDSNGQLVAGCSAGTAMNHPMPMFAIQGVNDFDANSDVGNISGGIMSAVVATGGFEIETTQYDTAGTYNPNDLLTADTGTTGDVRRMGESPYGGQVGVGCISEGVSTNADGKSVLRFWTLFLPAGPTDDNSSSSTEVLALSTSSQSSSSQSSSSQSSSSQSSSSSNSSSNSSSSSSNSSSSSSNSSSSSSNSSSNSSSSSSNSSSNSSSSSSNSSSESSSSSSESSSSVNSSSSSSESSSSP